MRQRASPFLTLALSGLNLYHLKCVYVGWGECNYVVLVHGPLSAGDLLTTEDIQTSLTLYYFHSIAEKANLAVRGRPEEAQDRSPPRAPRYLSAGRRRPGRSGTRGCRPAAPAPPPRQPAGGGSNPPGSSSSAAPAGHTAASHPDKRLTLGRPRPRPPDETALLPPAPHPPSARTRNPSASIATAVATQRGRNGRGRAQRHAAIGWLAALRPTVGSRRREAGETQEEILRPSRSGAPIARSGGRGGATWAEAEHLERQLALAVTGRAAEDGSGLSAPRLAG